MGWKRRFPACKCESSLSILAVSINDGIYSLICGQLAASMVLMQGDIYTTAYENMQCAPYPMD